MTGGVAHAYVRDKQGNLTVFDVSGAGTGPGQGTVGEGINPAGAVAGQYIDSGGGNHGYVRDRNGNVMKFDAPRCGHISWSGHRSVYSQPRGSNLRRLPGRQQCDSRLCAVAVKKPR